MHMWIILGGAVGPFISLSMGLLPPEKLKTLSSI